MSDDNNNYKAIVGGDNNNTQTNAVESNVSLLCGGNPSDEAHPPIMKI